MHERTPWLTVGQEPSSLCPAFPHQPTPCPRVRRQDSVVLWLMTAVQPKTRVLQDLSGPERPWRHKCSNPLYRGTGRGESISGLLGAIFRISVRKGWGSEEKGVLCNRGSVFMNMGHLRHMCTHHTHAHTSMNTHTISISL